MNTFGQLFKITTFGESHGKSLGVIIDGCPAGIDFDEDFLQSELQRRKPGQSAITTQRKEEDQATIQSGVFEGKTTGTPIGILIPNKDAKSKDYAHISDAYRPSHADYTYQTKYGIRDHRGGGRSSARETANWVAAGAVAKTVLSTRGITIQAYVSAVGKLRVANHYSSMDLTQTESNAVRCPDAETAAQMEAYIKEIKKAGDTVGGMITCVIKNTPVGLGEPVFNKLHAALAHAMMSINAVKGFEYGSGFNGIEQKGSEQNDLFVNDKEIRTTTNNSGGIQGGISNGEDIYFNVAFKPVATIMQAQMSINAAGETESVSGKGRHDPCVVPRAVPIVEAMAALVLVDFLLLSQTTKLSDS
jgi:chorismate synthase